MDPNRLTEKTQEALQRAQALAVRRNHQGVDVEHLLAALLEEPEGLASAFLAAAGIAPSAVRERVEQELNRLPQVSGPGTAAQQVYVTQRLARVLTQAEEEAKALKDEYVSVAPAVGHAQRRAWCRRATAARLGVNAGATDGSLAEGARASAGHQP